MIIRELISRFWVYLPDGAFQAYPPRPTGWTHIVLNYFGPNNGEGLTVFYDGEKVGGDNSKNEELLSVSGDGRIVVGRRWTDSDREYTSVQVDELIFFNQALSNENINSLDSVV